MVWFDDFAEEMYGGTRPEVASALAPIIINRLGLEASSTLLDLCCGRGHFSMAASKYLRNVFAIDNAPSMIDYLVTHGSPSITCLLGDASTKDMSQLAADACVVLWNSLGYSGQGSDIELLSNARNAVVANGHLVVEQHVLEDLQVQSERTTIERRGSGTFIRRRSISGQQVTADWSVIDSNGTRLKHARFQQYLYSRRELLEVIDKAGFEPYAVEKIETTDLGQAQSTFFFARARTID
jgi:SAM-dependent methyltransferase